MAKLIPLCLLISLCGCSLDAETCGLKPIYPPAKVGNKAWPQSAAAWKAVYEPVDSLQPTMRWEPYEPTDAVDPKSVRYDLRIWATANDCPTDEVYARDGLAETAHQIATPLNPASFYFWAVRARFLVAGEERVSPWSCARYPWGIGRDTCKLPQIPCANYLRFKTP